MPVVVESPYATIGPGIQRAGSALAGAIGGIGEKYEEQRDQQRYGSILSETIGSLGPDASPMEVISSLTEAVNRGVPEDMAQKYGTLYSTLQKSKTVQDYNPEDVESMSNILKDLGFDETESDNLSQLWHRSPPGAKTEITRHIVDRASRSQFQPLTENGEEIVTQPEVEEFKFPKVDVFEERTPKERVSLKTNLLKSNTVKVAEASEDIRNKQNLEHRYDTLKTLNESGQLPEGTGVLNVNLTTGELRFPRGANAETQDYVKAINDFTTQAKDTFGARVTNFELGTFMKRLPTLANNTEGRTLIIDQMQLQNQADQLYNKALLDVYNHYGVQNIDFSNADKIARGMIKDETDFIRKKALETLNFTEIKEAKLLAPEGKIPARSPEGKMVYVWRHQADNAEKQGYRIL